MSSSSPIVSAGTVSGAFAQSTIVPFRLMRMRVRQASPPTSTTKSARPAAMSTAVRLTSACGELPPAVV